MFFTKLAHNQELIKEVTGYLKCFVLTKCMCDRSVLFWTLGRYPPSSTVTVDKY